MAILEEDIISITPPKLGPVQAIYLPEVFKGLGTTFKHMIGSIANGKLGEKLGHNRNKTMQYPEEKREDLPLLEGGLFKDNFRGVHRLNRDEDGRVKCVACFMCATACPAHCIHIEGEESPWEDREKYPRKFDLDELRCIYCGMCEEACPVDAIELTPTYNIVGLSRNEMIFDKEKLLSVFDQTIDQKPM